MTEIRNIWKDYGFSKNPYHTEHLRPTDEDASLYVRRKEEEKELGDFLASEEAGAVVVEGAIGCGKTTFINQTQYQVSQNEELPQILPSTSLVEIVDDMGPRELVLSIITTTLKALKLNEKDIATSEDFKELDRYTRKVLIHNWSAGGTVFGFGASGGKSATSSEPADIPLQSLQDLLDTAARLAREASFEKIVILLNNLDNTDEEHFFGLLHDLRDTILERKPYLFVMSGPIGLRQSLASSRAHRRISEKITGNPVQLGALTKKQVHEVLARRVKKYRVNPEVRSPVPDQAIDVLYEASGGEIRYILNRANGIARTVAQKLVTAGGIEEDLAFAALQEIVREEVENYELSERKWEVLQQIVEQGEVQPRDYENFDLNSPQAFTNYLTEFHKMKLLERSREGRNTIYTPRGDIRLYFENAQANYN